MAQLKYLFRDVLDSSSFQSDLPTESCLVLVTFICMSVGVFVCLHFALYIYRSNSYLKLQCVDDVFTQIPFDHSMVTITHHTGVEINFWNNTSLNTSHTLYLFVLHIVCSNYVYVIFLLSLHDSQYRFLENLSVDVSS